MGKPIEPGKVPKANKPKGLVARSLLTLLGVALILYALVPLLLGIVGSDETAVITSVRRQGGERNEAVPNRYTYVIGYTFTLDNGKSYDGFVYRIGSAVYVKSDGTSTAGVKYFRPLPFIHTLTQDTELSWGQPVTAGAGVFLIYIMNRRVSPGKRKKKSRS